MRKLAILLLGTCSAVAHGQTNDHLYRSWRWETAPRAPRAAGLGGAFVGVADDSSATWLNPAGLTTLPKTEVGGGVLITSEGSAGRDRLTAWSGLDFVAGAGRLGRRFAVGGYLVRPRAGRLELSDVALPDGSRADGYLEADIVDVGAVGAYKATSRLNVGARVTATRLRLEGAYRRFAPSSRVTLESGTAAGQTRVTASLGILYEVTRALRVGLLVAPGASYLANRTANGTVGAVDVGSPYELRAPGLLSAGASIQVDPRLVIAVQVDYVRYSEIRAFVRPGAAQTTGYGIEDGIEPRLGAERSWPVGALALQLRAGVHSQAAGSLRFTGSDPIEAAAFPGSSRRLLWATGASIVSKAGIHLDVAGVFGGDRRELLGALRVRF